MKTIKAFVGRSFTEDDEQILNKILDYLDVISTSNLSFTWEDARPAKPKVVSDKVLDLLKGKDLFIGICTKKEKAFLPSPTSKSAGLFSFNKFKVTETEAEWKTSDWIIQEIGLAIGLGLKIILLVENGVRNPGELQGNLERIYFDRNAPEKSFPQLLEMIASLSARATANLPNESEPNSPTAAPPKIEDLDSSKKPDWLRPEANWETKDFELSYMHLIATGEKEQANQVERDFLSRSTGSDSRIAAEWAAFSEHIRILFNSNGNISKLLALAEANKDSSKITDYLARLYRRHGEHKKAAQLFNEAAGLSVSAIEKLRLIGEAALCYQKAEDPASTASLIGAMKLMRSDDLKNEEKILRIEQQLAEANKNDEIAVGSMERLLEIDPFDHDTRFTLAYKCTEMGRNEIALFHYSKIPADHRSHATWNNLGVSFDRLNIPSKAVTAYRKSEELGGTLAKSNLANKFLDAGFLSEAMSTCESALEVEDHHKNVDSTIVRLKEIPEEEDEKENAIYKKSKPVSDYYKDFGKAVSRSIPTDIYSKWVGPNCELSVSISGADFVATGSYEVPVSKFANALALSGTGLIHSDKVELKPQQYTVEYRGKLYGRAIIGTTKRKKVGEQPKPSSILGSALEDGDRALLFLTDSGNEIRVLEYEGNETKAYSLSRT